MWCWCYRIKVTMMLISMGQAPRYGGRRIPEWMRSFLVQVCTSILSMLIYDLNITNVGTGGTIAGTGRYMKSMNEDVRVVLADPEGSGLYNKVITKPTDERLH